MVVACTSNQDKEVVLPSRICLFMRVSSLMGWSLLHSWTRGGRESAFWANNEVEAKNRMAKNDRIIRVFFIFNSKLNPETSGMKLCIPPSLRKFRLIPKDPLKLKNAN